MRSIRGVRPIDKTKIRRILIRPSNWVGDVVMNIPAIEAIRENFPESIMSVVARPWVIPLLENHPDVDRVLTFRKGNDPLSRILQIIRMAGWYLPDPAVAAKLTPLLQSPISV